MNTNNNEPELFQNTEIISCYSKQDAINDGFQACISDLYPQIVKEAGFLIPVYFTSGVLDYVNVPETLNGLQDFNGRLWDTLYLARLEVKRMINENDTLGIFQVGFLTDKKDTKTNDYKINHVKLYIAFSEYEGFTVMLPEED